MKNIKLFLFILICLCYQRSVLPEARKNSLLLEYELYRCMQLLWTRI